MNNGNEWYWNLNLHRNQSVLSNLPAVNGTQLPISSAMYTSAVLTDRGICVGMRNVNLKGSDHIHSAKMQEIPNCCSISNVVGQRNKQTWAAAYDRMRFSALTDPSMATEVEYYHNHAKWKDRTIYPMEECMHEPVQDYQSLISAELNPFHLFGDKSKLSTIQLKGRQNHELLNLMSSISVNNSKCNDFIPQISHAPYINYPHFIEFGKNCLEINDYASFYHNKSMSSRSISPAPQLRGRKLKATIKFRNRRMDTNASRPNHVVAPKKKWIRNYMQSNSHLWFFYEYIIFGCFVCFFHFQYLCHYSLHSSSFSFLCLLREYELILEVSR